MTQNIPYNPAAAGGPVWWQPLGRGVLSMGFDLSVDWNDAWARDLEPSLRGSVIPEDAEETDDDRPAWVVRKMGGRDRSVMVETIDAFVDGEMYSWCPGFFNIYTDMAPADAPPASVRVWLGDQLLRFGGGAEGALSLVCEYFNDLGAKVAAPRLGGMELAADFLIEGEISQIFFNAHARLDQAIRGLGTTDSFHVTGLEHALGVTLWRKSATDVLARGGTIGTALDRASAERVWCVRFLAFEPVLRRIGIDPTQLPSCESMALAWRWLATEEFSLRVPGAGPWESRPAHPWWQAVHDAWNG